MKLFKRIFLKFDIIWVTLITLVVAVWCISQTDDSTLKALFTILVIPLLIFITQYITKKSKIMIFLTLIYTFTVKLPVKA